MLVSALTFLLDTFLGLFALALLLRFYLQVMRAPVRNPLSTFVVALTDWVVVPTRRIVPGLFRMDLSTLLLAWLTELTLSLLKHWVRVLMTGVGAVPSIGLLAVFAALQIIKLSIWIVFFAVLAQAVLSWVAPYSPAMPVVGSLTRPFLAAFRRRIPPVGNVDLSPMFVGVICMLLLMVVAGLEDSLG
jgi:YggT family protein